MGSSGCPLLLLLLLSLLSLLRNYGQIHTTADELKPGRKPLPHGPWRDLTHSEMDAWYSPFDQCMMNTSDFDKSPQQIKREHCANADIKIAGKMGFCRVGMGSNKKECSSPYSGRLSYRRGVGGFTDAAATPLIEAFQRVCGDLN